MSAPDPLVIGEWYRVVEGSHAGRVGTLSKVEEVGFGRLFADLVVDDGQRMIRTRIDDLEAVD